MIDYAKFDERPIVVAVAGPMRLSQGGHDVPDAKLETRFPRTLRNLAQGIRRLPNVLVFDNDDLARPFRLVAELENGRFVTLKEPVPHWLEALL